MTGNIMASDTSNGTGAPYTLLVNSSDGFADCWEPFFRLLDIYWPDRNCPILLNTEQSSYSGGRQGISSSKVNQGIDRRLTWSECLIAAIKQIENPLLLYMQEDYFLDSPVHFERLEQAVKLMLSRPDIKHIGLTRHGSLGPFEESGIDGFLKIGSHAKYRISTQAGLWRPETLLSYLDPAESGWMFEIFGTRRAWRRQDLFLTVDLRHERPVFDYTHTGIIKGQWHPAIPELFAEHAIEMDFDRRGFHKRLPGILNKWTLARKIMKDPHRALRNLVLEPLGLLKR